MNRNQAGFLPSLTSQTNLPLRIDADQVRLWFSDPTTVAHYRRAAATLGLWRAEEILITQVFDLHDRLLDIGCGAGRIAFGLWRLGFREVCGVDFCPQLVDEARQLAEALDIAVPFQVGDARKLALEDGTFSGAIFGFNGLMQIPGRAERRRALEELRRVVRPGGQLIFTTPDRDLAAERSGWEAEKVRWAAGKQAADLVDFGDRVLHRPEGRIFMHLPDRAEVLEDLTATGWSHAFDELRSRLANEPQVVREFADECRFWVALR